MARIFRATYTKLRTVMDRKGRVIYDLRNGKKVPRRVPVLGRDGKPVLAESRKWCIEYRGADGKVRRRAGFTDRKATEQLAAQLERQAERQRAGIVDIEVAHLKTPLMEHIEAYLADLRRAGRDDMYVYNLDKRLHKLARKCGWHSLGAIGPDSLSRWLAERKQRGTAPRTLNQYIEAASSFMAWAVRNRRAETNTLADMPKANDADRRRVRRALTAEEVRTLLEVSGERQLLYLTAVLTGLRRSELAALRWDEVVLDSDTPHIALRAVAAKSRRQDFIPLAPELVEALGEARRAAAGPAAPVFATVPSIRRFKADLTAAGIAYKDESGRQADFHSLRVTFGTILAKSGVNVRTAMEMMRHTDIRLTTRVYTDPTLLDTAAAAEGLPRLGPPWTQERVRATGTEGRAVSDSEKRAPRLAFCLAFQGASSDNDQSPPGTPPRQDSRGTKAPKGLEKSSVSTSGRRKGSPGHRPGNRGGKSWGTRIRT